MSIKAIRPILCKNPNFQGKGATRRGGGNGQDRTGQVDLKYVIISNLTNSVLFERIGLKSRNNGSVIQCIRQLNINVNRKLEHLFKMRRISLSLNLYSPRDKL